MNRKFSMPKHYQLQGELAKKHGISEFHAGCHITHYPDSNLCSRCTRAEECAKIFLREKDSGIYEENEK